MSASKPSRRDLLPTAGWGILASALIVVAPVLARWELAAGLGAAVVSFVPLCLAIATAAEVAKDWMAWVRDDALAELERQAETDRGER